MPFVKSIRMFVREGERSAARVAIAKSAAERVVFVFDCGFGMKILFSFLFLFCFGIEEKCE